SLVLNIPGVRRNPDRVAHEAVALVEIGKGVFELTIVGIDGAVRAVEGAELSGNLAAVDSFAQSVVCHELQAVIHSFAERDYQAVVPGVDIARTGEDRPGSGIQARGVEGHGKGALRRTRGAGYVVAAGGARRRNIGVVEHRQTKHAAYYVGTL